MATALEVKQADSGRSGYALIENHNENECPEGGGGHFRYLAHGLLVLMQDWKGESKTRRSKEPVRTLLRKWDRENKYSSLAEVNYMFYLYILIDSLAFFLPIDVCDI